MTFGKRQLMIGALVAALGTAVYLNWQFSGVQPVSVSGADESSSISKQLGQRSFRVRKHILPISVMMLNKPMRRKQYRKRQKQRQPPMIS